MRVTIGGRFGIAGRAEGGAELWLREVQKAAVGLSASTGQQVSIADERNLKVPGGCGCGSNGGGCAHAARADVDIRLRMVWKVRTAALVPPTALARSVCREPYFHWTGTREKEEE